MPTKTTYFMDNAPHIEYSNEMYWGAFPQSGDNEGLWLVAWSDDGKTWATQGWMKEHPGQAIGTAKADYKMLQDLSDSEKPNK